MWRFRRFRLLALSVLLVAATVTVLVGLRKIAPPEPARLLPGADAFVYVNLQWARRATILTGLPQVKRSPEYERFVQDSGIDFERDLEQAAFAVHYRTPATPAIPGIGGLSSTVAPDGATAEARYSEVFVGHLNAARLGDYLRRLARSADSEEGVEIYSIPLEGHILRAAILGPDMVALSNHEDPEVIRGIVVRSRKRASPFGGPSFLRTYYRKVPFASMAWIIARVDPRADSKLPSNLGNGLLPIEPGALVRSPAVVVGSARLIRAVHLRAETFTKDPDEARELTEKLNAFLTLFRFSEAETPSGGPDADVKAFFQSLQVSQNNERSVLTATMPLGFLRKVFRDPGAPGEAQSDLGDNPGITPQEAERKAIPKAAAPQTR
jgi:hypothetical protein